MLTTLGDFDKRPLGRAGAGVVPLFGLGCAADQQPVAVAPSEASAASSSQSGASGSNPVIKEMTKIIDLAHNPNESMDVENRLASDGTGTITVRLSKLKLLTPRARGLAVAASGIANAETADLTKTPIPVRTEISRPAGALQRQDPADASGREPAGISGSGAR